MLSQGPRHSGSWESKRPSSSLSRQSPHSAVRIPQATGKHVKGAPPSGVTITPLSETTIMLESMPASAAMSASVPPSSAAPSAAPVSGPASALRSVEQSQPPRSMHAQRSVFVSLMFPPYQFNEWIHTSTPSAGSGGRGNVQNVNPLGRGGCCPGLQPWPIETGPSIKHVPPPTTSTYI